MMKSALHSIAEGYEKASLAFGPGFTSAQASVRTTHSPTHSHRPRAAQAAADQAAREAKAAADKAAADAKAAAAKAAAAKVAAAAAKVPGFA